MWLSLCIGLKTKHGKTMAKHTRKEFQELTGVSSQTISVYISRKKLTPIWIGKKIYLDDKDPKNVAFINSRIDEYGKSRKQAQIIKDEAKANTVFPEIKELSQKPKRYKSPVFENGLSVPEVGQQKLAFDEMTIENQKKHLEVEKLKEEIEIKRIQKEKQQGLVIPTDVVINLFSTTFKSFINEFYAASEDLGNITVYGLGGKREDVVKFRDTLIKTINKASDKSTKAAMKSIDGIIDVYSEKRSRGESK